MAKNLFYPPSSSSTTAFAFHVGGPIIVLAMTATASPSRDEQLARAARAIRGAEYLVIAAGAGMGVDSGLPDFRGPQGFWRAYPAFEKLGLRFEEIANARWFDEDPHLAWGFYGHRLNLYRRTRPHEGFEIL